MLTLKKYSYISEIFKPYFSNLQQEGSDLVTQFPEIVTFNDSILNNSCLKKLYDLVIENIINHSYIDSIFFAEKLLTLTEGHPIIVYLLGECYFYNQDYKKVHSLFVKYKLLNYNPNFQILAARSLAKNKQYDLCLSVLDVQLEKPYQNSKIESQKHLLKGNCHEATENKLLAIEDYFECLKKDPSCHEAFNRLIDCYLLNSQQKQQLLTMLNFNAEDKWIQKYYITRIKNEYIEEKKTDKVSESQMQLEDYSNVQFKISDIKAENMFSILNQKNNIDFLCIKAKNAHQKYDIQKAYEICIKAIKNDPLYFDIIPIYCACLLDLNLLGELYYCAHNLIENYSNHPLAWFSIGTYYYLTKKYDTARKFFQKALQIDPNFIQSWIGLAHSFAIQDESDQAMSIYRTIARQFPGCYQAHLYMGQEYLRTNNLKTAILSFNYAKEINPNDPLICNELGVIYFKQKMYIEAKEKYMMALGMCEDAASWILETIYSNLAHTYRKLKDFKNSIKYYEKCITLNPKNPFTYFSLAYTYHISNQLNKAICFYHKSLHFKNDNQFAHDMLNKCLTDAADIPFENVYNI